MVYSQCKSRHLTYGEVTFIIMEHIEIIPSSLALGIQNCTHTYCNDNPNLIEYYFTYSDSYTYSNLFSSYRNYLFSKRRKEFITHIRDKNR